MALVILILSFVLDWFNDKGGTVLMFAIPFVVFLITGKQYFDRGKEKNIWKSHETRYIQILQEKNKRKAKGIKGIEI